ncbi:hypothetical protein ACFQL0_21125, partial [Haloplanus litoreus]|uniref:hypothetical protein n=1 Tax=Haloplanus litoreus TaxID=767515 RepID=UPI00361E7033
ATNPAGSTATSEVSQTTNGPAPTFGSLTVVDDSGDGHADAFDCDFTRGGSDEDHLEIRGSIDNGSSFSQLGTDQTPDTTQYTTPEQDDGQEYVLKVTAVYPDTESDSGTLTRTTDPRDLSQDDITPVDTSVEDQLRIPNPGVADYGDYRGQLRVTNSGDAYGSDVVVAYDGADLVFTGLPDGEKFDLQGRHETEHVNGVGGRFGNHPASSAGRRPSGEHPSHPGHDHLGRHRRQRGRHPHRASPGVRRWVRCLRGGSREGCERDPARRRHDRPRRDLPVAGE